MPQDTSRLMLVLTIPQLRLPAKEAALILQHFSAELIIVLKAFVASFVVCMKDLLFAIPNVVLVYEMLLRLPLSVSLVLRDNINFEDALGRMQSLQFQHFQHWPVFEASLRCNFQNLPGMLKVVSGEHVLTTPKHKIQLRPHNWSELIRPGFIVKMAIMINTVQTSYQECPRGCGSRISKFTDKDYSCEDCKLVFAVQQKSPQFSSMRQEFGFMEAIRPCYASLYTSPKEANPSNPSLVGPRGDGRSQIRAMTLLHLRNRVRTDLKAPKIKDAILRPEIDSQADYRHQSRMQAELEDLKLLKRVHLTGKDLIPYRFRFSFSWQRDNTPRAAVNDTTSYTTSEHRVKVYELGENDWFDSGTGFCTGKIVDEEPRIFVRSEAQPTKLLLETRTVQSLEYLIKIDAQTLIYWTEQSGTDLCLSFQEVSDCALMSEFIHYVQTRFKEDAPAVRDYIDIPPPQPPIRKIEKKYVCEGQVRSAPGTKWGCGRRYATVNALCHHLYSGTGQICIKLFIDEEQEAESDAYIARPLPASLLEQHPQIRRFDDMRAVREKNRVITR